MRVCERERSGKRRIGVGGKMGHVIIVLPAKSGANLEMTLLKVRGATEG